ncbi:MAG: hypothetical protein KDB01_08970 [Planctomycetaceae bacterium]|nr:hypothetical protein [Planctomycetaceae bacterium]
MQKRLIFATPEGIAMEAQQGYRLQKIELINWGTFDSANGQVYSVTPAGQTTLLVGRNGCGKSTLVDALLTLLVRPSIRNFNVAAGGGKRERDERTYVKGAYDRGGYDESNSSQPKFLRPKGNHYSVILAVFGSEGTGKKFTIAQVLYLTADQMVEKLYCFADGERSIRDDFGGFEGTDTILKLLKKRGIKVTRTHAEFETWFSKVTNVRAKAMEVFNQTVAVKDIQKLNDFIRNHMLEQADRGERVDRLLTHFTELCDAHASLVRVQQQALLLEPVAVAGKDCLRLQQELKYAERQLSATAAFLHSKTIEIFEPVLLERQRAVDDVRAEQDRLKQASRRLEEQSRGLQNEIDQAGGDRLRLIPLLIDTAEAQAAQVRSERKRFQDALHKSGLEATVDDIESFRTLRASLPDLQATLKGNVSELETQLVDIGVARRATNESIRQCQAELDGLNRRRENIPERSVELRAMVCRDLGLNVIELPFVAELVAVRPEEREWEASIEKVLNSFAMSLLVPERLYAAVSSYVDRTRLAVHGQGQRLVYLQIGRPATSMNSTVPTESSLLSKLAFREGHTLLPWVKAELQQRFDYRCCDTVEEFQQCRGLAMTASRHIKSGQRRHDKDDREKISDPRNFVLGWDNREKKRRIADELIRLQQEETKLTGRSASINQQLHSVRDRLQAVAALDLVMTYDQIDPSSFEQTIISLRREAEQISSKSDVLKGLQQRLAEVEDQREATRLATVEAVRNQTNLERDIGVCEQQLSYARSGLERRTRDGLLDEDREYFEGLSRQLVGCIIDEAELSTGRLERQIKEQVGRHVEARRTELEPVQRDLLKLMSKFLQKFPDEGQDLAIGIEYLDSFLGLRQRIVEEDLPRHEQRFRERLNEKVIHEIGLFRAELESERRQIEDRIEILNASLKQLEYRPGTHIQLEPRPVRDREVVEFQTRLRECIESSFDDSAAANEARFERIRELVEKLRDENNRRWRDKVTDVRRWFDFVAAVINRETLETISVYQDSSGQSGGEKAKLAFTILVAAIAYQYDLDPEHPTPDRFQFVVVDEMFSRVDDQHAEYAMELFRQFGLQLLIVAPLDAKARVTQPYVGCYLHVNKRDNRSEIFEMTATAFADVMGETGGDL